MATMETSASSASNHEALANSRRTRNSWLLSLPAVLLLLIGASGPLLVLLVCSFLEPGDYGGVIWKPGIEAWFKTIFSDGIGGDAIQLADAHLLIFWRSVKVSLLTVLVTFALGFPTAYFIATRPRPQRTVWLFLITIPFWSSLLIRTIAILEMIRGEGVINTLAIWIGFIDQPMQMLHTEGAVLLGMAYVYLPLMVLPLHASIERFDFRLLEAGYDLYANRWQVFRRIVLPLAGPGIVAGSILVFVSSLGAYVTPRVLGGDESAMIASLIGYQFSQAENWPLGAALAILLLAAVAIVLVIFIRTLCAERANDR